MERVIAGKRANERFKVDWPGTLTCRFPNHEEDLKVRISEISLSGARLELETLKIGPYHVVVGSDQSGFTLKMHLPEVTVSTVIRIVWYSLDEGKRHFNVGVLFPQEEEGRSAAIERVVKARS
ncbi:MAG: PilZ domain-containing protein [Desulfobacteraceae bacterium]|nr:PilZ domain-containing protein [Desulfobacteraceae bacterium]